MRRATLSAARIPLSRNRLVPAVIVARREVERRRVDAIAQAGRVRAVREEVAQMSAAMAARDLGPPHPERIVFLRRDVALLDDVVEARPTRPRFELRPRIEERFVAHDAAIRSLAMVVPVRAGKRRLGARLLGYRVLDRAELGATLVDFWIARHFASPRFGLDAGTSVRVIRPFAAGSSKSEVTPGRRSGRRLRGCSCGHSATRSRASPTSCAPSATRGSSSPSAF